MMMMMMMIIRNVFQRNTEWILTE